MSSFEMFFFVLIKKKISMNNCFKVVKLCFSLPISFNYQKVTKPGYRRLVDKILLVPPECIKG